MGALRDMFGDVVPEPIGVQTSAWSTDPWARGSYSYLGVGSEPGDYAALAQPVAELIFFAGEATDPEYHSTVHGAVLSGRRAAAECSMLSRERRASRPSHDTRTTRRAGKFVGNCGAEPVALQADPD